MKGNETNDCIFCKIVNGDIPCAKVYEDNSVLAFLDIMPANNGHLLVVSKEHHATFTDIPKHILSDLFVAAQKLANAVKSATGCDGYNILMNAGEASGQVVMHAHLHIIPKFADDKWKLDWPQKKYEENEIDEWKKKVKGAI